jgi:hypothetical protein
MTGDPAKVGAVAAIAGAAIAAWIIQSGGQPAAAQVAIDMAQITCGDFMNETPAQQKFIAAWMNGYFHAKQNQPEVDWPRFNTSLRAVWNYCRSNRNVTVMNAISKAAF